MSITDSATAQMNACGLDRKRRGDEAEENKDSDQPQHPKRILRSELMALEIYTGPIEEFPKLVEKEKPPVVQKFKIDYSNLKFKNRGELRNFRSK